MIKCDRKLDKLPLLIQYTMIKYFFANIINISYEKHGIEAAPPILKLPFLPARTRHHRKA